MRFAGLPGDVTACMLYGPRTESSKHMHCVTFFLYLAHSQNEKHLLHNHPGRTRIFKARFRLLSQPSPFWKRLKDFCFVLESNLDKPSEKPAVRCRPAAHPRLQVAVAQDMQFVCPDRMRNVVVSVSKPTNFLIANEQTPLLLKQRFLNICGSRTTSSAS